VIDCAVVLPTSISSPISGYLAEREGRLIDIVVPFSCATNLSKPVDDGYSMFLGEEGTCGQKASSG
jgi:hypothetical protein